MKKILIIDDSYFMRLAVRKLFAEKKEFNFVESSGGEESLKLFDKEKPDLVLLDVVMPHMRGIEVLKKIMKMDPGAKVIMITAVGRETVIEKCKKLGAFAYIKKPFEESQVRNIVEKCLGS